MKNKIFKLALSLSILIVAGFFVLGTSIKNAAAAEMTVDTVWTKAQSPIIVNDYIWLKPGVNLTIEKGVVIKFNSSGILIISGKLTAIGTKAEPIVFTSIKDDAYGGDTNGDGSATLPKAGDWYYLSVNVGGEANLDYNVIQYGGGVYYSGAVLAYKGKLIVTNSIITKNNAGISNIQGVVTISNSSIMNNPAPFIGGVWVDAAVANNGRADIIVNAANNWWGSADGPCSWRQLPPGDVKSICGDRSLVDLGVVFSPWLTKSPDEPAEPEPVILVPGIMGSWKVSGKWELDPIFHTYDNLWQALKLAGYEEGKNLFSFPYQWRLSNSYTAILLKQKIQEVKDICQCDKVDIISHSMGGLVARAYIESNDYQNDIDQLIFLAVPHKGATKTYLTWEAGEFGPKYSDKLFQRILSIEAEFNGYGSLFNYINNLPMQSLQELLPTYDYLRDKDTMELRIYPNNYPVNTFLELLNNPSQLDKLNSINITNILASAGENSTINSLRVEQKEFIDGEWEHGYPENYNIPFTDHGLEFGAGDDTVSEQSNKDFLDLENIFISSNHNDIATDAQKTVIKELTDTEPIQEVRLNAFQKFFMVRIFSPADFVIIAPDGKKLGKDFASGQTINEIEGAFYSGFDSDIEFAVIPDPTDGEYKVELQGTDQGEYKLSASFIDEEREIDKEFSGNIQTGQNRDFILNYLAEAEDPIGELKPQDTVPPAITINVPQPSQQYLRNQDLIVDYTATDDFSGIAATTIIIDGQEVATTTIDLFDFSLGVHTLIITALDKAGNFSQVQVDFEIVANIESTIDDIEEIHERGWFKGKIYHPLLINAFKLLKIEEKYFEKEEKLTEKLIKKAEDDKKLNPKQKQKLIDQYNKKLKDLKKNRDKALDRSLDLIEKLLNTAKRLNQINQQGYNIILSNINYLRENL